MDLLVVLVNFRRVVHRAEFRAAHGAERGVFVALFWQRFIVHGASGFGIERELELLFPVELVAGIAEGVVAVPGAGTMARNVCSVRGNLVGDNAVLHVFLVGQAEVLLRRDVAEHGCAVPADHGGADRRRNVVVARRDVGDERAQSVERCFVAELLLFLDLLFDLVERNMPGPSIMTCTSYSQAFLVSSPRVSSSANCASIAGVGDASRTQSIAEGKAHIVLRENLADVVKTFVEKVLLVVVRHPLGQNRAAAAYDAGDALGNHRQILDQYAGVDGHVVHALLGLFLDDFEHHVGVQVFDALHARNRFIDRHGADRHGRMAQDGFANLVNVAAGGEIHHGIGAIVNGRVQLLQFLIDVRGDGGVADVRVDLAERGDADRHRLEFGMIDVGRDDHAPARDFVADQFRRGCFSL